MAVVGDKYTSSSRFISSINPTQHFVAVANLDRIMDFMNIHQTIVMTIIARVSRAVVVLYQKFIVMPEIVD